MRLSFGTDGIRGAANEILTPAAALALGRAAADVLAVRRFVVGRDTRLSGPMLESALCAGLAAQGADIAMAATRENGQVMAQPVMCLLKSTLLESLVKYLEGGQRKIDGWTASHRVGAVAVHDAAAFDNANTAEELQRLQR